MILIYDSNAWSVVSSLSRFQASTTPIYITHGWKYNIFAKIPWEGVHVFGQNLKGGTPFCVLSHFYSQVLLEIRLGWGFYFITAIALSRPHPQPPIVCIVSLTTTYVHFSLSVNDSILFDFGVIIGFDRYV